MNNNSLNVYMADLMVIGHTIGKVFYGQGIRGKKSILEPDFYDELATTPFQTHSMNVRVVDSAYDTDLPDTDALVTFRDNVAIGVRTADCVPILLYAEDVGATAAVHAGWRGSLGGIVDNTLDVLEEHGADPAKLKVAFGPSISKEHYEVDEDLAGKFAEGGFGSCVSYPDGDGGKPHLDLQGVNILRLLRRGVKSENIKPSKYCTFSSRRKDGEYMFPSYRRDGTSDRMLTSIMRLDPDKFGCP